MKKFFCFMLVAMLAFGVVAGCTSDNGGDNGDNGNGGEEPTYTYNNGIYTGFSDESRGHVKVQITITNDNVRAMQIWEHDNMGRVKDYETYGTDEDGNFPVGTLKEAHDALIDAVLEANTWEVDVVAGATSTSNKVKQAVERAMEKALVEQPANAGEYFDGKFMGAYRGERGAVLVVLTIENDEITEAVVSETAIREGTPEALKDYDTYGNDNFTGEFLKEAHEALAAAFVDANGADVDEVTGATSTSTGAIEAAKLALEAAKR